MNLFGAGPRRAVDRRGPALLFWLFPLRAAAPPPAARPAAPIELAGLPTPRTGVFLRAAALPPIAGAVRPPAVGPLFVTNL